MIVRAQNQRNDIWIVGATQGLGLAMAIEYQKQGRRVVGMGRRAASPHDSVAKYVATDVRDATVFESTIRALLGTEGAPSVIVYCASVIDQGSILDRSEAALRTEVETNYLGFVRLCRAVARYKPGQCRVRLVAVASTLGYVGCPSADNYSATKAALISFARSVRAEMKPLGIDILILSPPHMTNGADLVGPRRFPVDWAAKRLIEAADRGREEHLLGASNRFMMRLGRWAPGTARNIMHSIGQDALRRRAAAEQETELIVSPPA